MLRQRIHRAQEVPCYGVVAREPGISEHSLRNWVKAFDAGKLTEQEAKAVTPEQMEFPGCAQRGSGCGGKTKS
ncbi:MAG: transposase [Candidatus Accumulibacter sp.]|nr:transposase [Accumulibacter sp.]